MVFYHHNATSKHCLLLCHKAVLCHKAKYIIMPQGSVYHCYATRQCLSLKCHGSVYRYYATRQCLSLLCHKAVLIIIMLQGSAYLYYATEVLIFIMPQRCLSLEMPQDSLVRNATLHFSILWLYIAGLTFLSSCTGWFGGAGGAGRFCWFWN